MSWHDDEWSIRSDWRGFRYLENLGQGVEIRCHSSNEVATAIKSYHQEGNMTFSEAKRLMRQVPIHLRGKYA